MAAAIQSKMNTATTVLIPPPPDSAVMTSPSLRPCCSFRTGNCRTANPFASQGSPGHRSRGADPCRQLTITEDDARAIQREVASVQVAAGAGL